MKITEEEFRASLAYISSARSDPRIEDIKGWPELAEELLIQHCLDEEDDIYSIRHIVPYVREYRANGYVIFGEDE